MKFSLKGFRTWLLLSCVALPVLFLSGCRAKGSDAINKNPAGVALKGYDVVAYFTTGKPVMGEKGFQHEWMNAKWQFSNAAHRDLFAATPSQYAPQYGGYCAYGVSEGHKVPVDPTAWTIVGGKLYLNYDEGVRKLWRQDVPGHIARADKNWPKVSKQ